MLALHQLILTSIKSLLGQTCSTKTACVDNGEEPQSVEVDGPSSNGSLGLEMMALPECDAFLTIFSSSPQ